MARVKRGVTARRRHKKILKQAKGYYNSRRKVFRVAKQAVTKALQEFIARRQQSRVADLLGKLEWDPSFDYKAERSRHP